MKFIDLTGQKFGRLTVVKRANDYISPKGTKSVCWYCKCDCDNEVVVRGLYLKNGHTQSCGCLVGEKIAQVNHTHGLKHTRLYGVWQNMKNRCYNFKVERYNSYGGRGITVCSEWRNDFQAFYDWAMANGYRDDLTLDRIDVNGNYEPSNCRWVDLHEQANNKRNNHYITYNGKTQTLARWANEKHIRVSTLRGRLKRGWSVEKALTTPA